MAGEALRVNPAVLTYAKFENKTQAKQSNEKQAYPTDVREVVIDMMRANEDKMQGQLEVKQNLSHKSGDDAMGAEEEQADTRSLSNPI